MESSFFCRRAYPQNYMVEQPRNPIAEMHFDKFPKRFRLSSVGKRAFKTEVCSCSGYLSEAMRWIQRSGGGRILWTIFRVDNQFEDIDFANFEMLDAKIGSSLQKIIPTFELQEKSQSSRADDSIRSPIPPRKTDRFYDL